jgi:hypothetical protein
MDLKELLEVHKTVVEELRHTSNVIWRFAVAIATLQGAAFALAGRKDANEVVGASALLIGFFLSFLFSLMLVRQATERRGFVARLRRFEEELDKLHEGMFQPIKSTLESFTSVVLARFLALESFLGFSAAFLFLVSRIGLPF